MKKCSRGRENVHGGVKTFMEEGKCSTERKNVQKSAHKSGGPVSRNKRARSSSVTSVWRAAVVLAITPWTQEEVQRPPSRPKMGWPLSPEEGISGSTGCPPCAYVVSRGCFDGVLCLSGTTAHLAGFWSNVLLRETSDTAVPGNTSPKWHSPPPENTRFPFGMWLT